MVKKLYRNSQNIYKKGKNHLNFNDFSILFELILMDLIMPEMNGYDATVEIRKLEKEFGLAESEKHFICGFSAEVNDRNII
jgi:CheY-like chemotaxis protein